MRLPIDPRRWRTLWRDARFDPLLLAELLVVALIAVQAARLAWAVVTPTGPVGAWTAAPGPDAAAGRAALAAGTDPFFRAGSGDASATVTALPFSLFGTRVDEATGRGSAILAASDNVQRSVAVGEEIEPGVTLKSVAFDHVVIRRAGRDESLFLVQTDSAPPAPVMGAQGVPVPPTVPAPASAPATEGQR
jgi:general secretion pathway protein C